MMRRIVIPYRPRPQQRQAHALTKALRFLVLVCHRRWGKTVFAINWLLRELLECPLPNPQGSYFCPIRDQAKKVAWKYVQHFAGVIPGVEFNQAELRCELPNGASLWLLGANNPDAVRGMYMDVVKLDEYAQMPPGFFTKVVRPMLADRKGRAIFGGTPQGRNEFYKLYERAAELDGWGRMIQRVSETHLIDSAELAAMKRELSADEYAQEMECAWSAAIVGAFYGKEMAQVERDGRATKVGYVQELPVWASFDLGIRDSVAALWQIAGTEVRCIDCRHYQGSSLVEILKDIGEQQHAPDPDKFIMPHDIRVQEFSTGLTRQEVMQERGIDPIICENIPELDGIDAVRRMLPRVWFDAERCNVLLDALAQFRVKYNEVTRSYSTHPLSDWTNHFADAVRYFAVHTGGQQMSMQWGGNINTTRRRARA